MTGIARERDFLSGDHALTDVDQRAVFSQVAVLARGAIVMQDHHVVGVFATKGN